MADESNKNHDRATPHSKVQAFIDAKSEEVTSDVKGMLRDDVIGIQDWKKSKVGFIFGLGFAKRAVGSVGSAAADSSNRLTGMFDSILAREDVPEVDPNGTEAERFIKGMKMQGLTEINIAVALRNTFWSACLYTALLVLDVVLMLVLAFKSSTVNAVVIMSLLGPAPFLLAMALKHAYTNWIFRKRILPGPAGIIRCIRTLEIIPRP
jgi:hypothetical protein